MGAFLESAYSLLFNAISMHTAEAGHATTNSADPVTGPVMPERGTT